MQGSEMEIIALNSYANRIATMHRLILSAYCLKNIIKFIGNVMHIYIEPIRQHSSGQLGV